MILCDNATRHLNGTPTSITPPTGDNSTQIATTQFVQTAIFQGGGVPGGPLGPITINANATQAALTLYAPQATWPTAPALVIQDDKGTNWHIGSNNGSLMFDDGLPQNPWANVVIQPFSNGVCMNLEVVDDGTGSTPLGIDAYDPTGKTWLGEWNFSTLASGKQLGIAWLPPSTTIKTFQELQDARKDTRKIWGTVLWKIDGTDSSVSLAVSPPTTDNSTHVATTQFVHALTGLVLGAAFEVLKKEPGNFDAALKAAQAVAGPLVEPPKPTPPRERPFPGSSRK